MTTTRTLVSKAHPAIRAILTATFPTYRGRKVTIVAADEQWSHTALLGDRIEIRGYDLLTGELTSFVRPCTYTMATKPGCALVIWSFERERHGVDYGIEIVIPAAPVDPDALAIAVDAALECGHAEWRKQPPPGRVFSRKIQLAPHRVRCTSCAAGTQPFDVGQAVELARQVDESKHGD